MSEKENIARSKEKYIETCASTVVGTKYVMVPKQRMGTKCPVCEKSAVLRKCVLCGTEAWIIDCGHYDQPPYIASVDGYSDICDECLDEWKRKNQENGEEKEVNNFRKEYRKNLIQMLDKLNNEEWNAIRILVVSILAERSENR